jgi:membrane associated rhomboid family serine protease
VKNLIIINVLVWLIQTSLDGQYNITGKLMLYPIFNDSFSPYQIATYMFAHSPGTISHIGFNMLGLWMFGRMLENVWGAKRFLIFYLASGVGAALCHLMVQYLRYRHAETLYYGGNPQEAFGIMATLGPMLGASGAIMGILAAFAYLFPKSEIYIPIPVKAKWAVIIFAAVDLFSGLTMPGDNIAHFTHLGGALTGFIIVLIWNKTNRNRFY